MRNYVAVVCKDESKAYEALHALWRLDSASEVTVHGTTIVHRDWLGHFHIEAKETYPALATAIGVGIGALLGALAGPAGAAIGAGGGAAVGAAAGGMIGGIADIDRADTREAAREKTRLVVREGEYAVIADVSEPWTSPINTQMNKLGAIVYRRSREEIENEGWYGFPYDYYGYYLDPYEYPRP